MFATAALVEFVVIFSHIERQIPCQESCHGLIDTYEGVQGLTESRAKAAISKANTPVITGSVLQIHYTIIATILIPYTEQYILTKCANKISCFGFVNFNYCKRFINAEFISCINK